MTYTRTEKKEMIRRELQRIASTLTIMFWDETIRDKTMISTTGFIMGLTLKPQQRPVVPKTPERNPTVRAYRSW